MMILIPGTSVLSSRYIKCSQEFYLEQNRQQLSLYLFKEIARPSWCWGLKFLAFSSAVGTPAMCISGIFVEQARMCPPPFPVASKWTPPQMICLQQETDCFCVCDYCPCQGCWHSLVISHFRLLIVPVLICRIDFAEIFLIDNMMPVHSKIVLTCVQGQEMKA